MTSQQAADTAPVAVAAARQVIPGADVIGVPWKLAGGAMHDSWAVDAEVDGSRRELVVRVSPAGRADHQKTIREFEVLKVAYARGVLCPEPIAVGECDAGEDYLVMARVTGDTNPRQLITGERFAETRKHIIRQLADNLARIHEVRLEDVPAAPGMVGPEQGEEPLAFQRRAVEANFRLDLLDPHPALEWAFRWLDRQLTFLPPTGRAPCLVHGDFRIGNMLYDERGLTSVLDWEGTHIGDPEEELAWFCTRVWRFGNHQMEAGGVAPREEWIRAYEEASGRPVSRERVAAWEVLQNIRWCQITMMQARAHLDGHTVSHELAAIGRRTAETELEVLRLTGVLGRLGHAG